MHTCIAFLTNVKKKTNWDRCFWSIDKLCAALTISLFRLKVLRFFPCLGPFCASALHIPTCYIYRFARDMKTRIHRLNFFFLSLETYHFLVFLKFEQNTWKNYPFCKINSQCRKTESLKKEVYNGIFCIFAF